MYALRFPFSLPEGRVLSPLEVPAVMPCYDRSVKLAKDSAGYVLTITSFPDEESATAFIPRVYAGMAWALLQYDLSADFDLQLQPVRYFEDPKEAAQRLFGADTEVGSVDAVIDGARPAITMTDKKVSVMVAGRPSLTAGVNANLALSAIAEAASFPGAEAVIRHAKLRTALDLYNLFFRERSSNARFLTLAMALEALSPAEHKPSYVIDMIAQWLSDIAQRKAALDPTTEEWTHYDAIEKEIGQRREVSIRKKVRTLVQRALSDQGARVAGDVAARAVYLYDKRSRLVHDGFLPEDELRSGTTELREIVRRVLQSKLAEASQKL